MQLTSCSDQDVSIVAMNLLTSALSINNTLTKQILLTLLNKYKELHEPSTEVEMILNQALCAFIRQSYSTLLFRAGNIALKNTQNSMRNNKSTKAVGTESLGLGDTLEILIGDRWVIGTIARSNGITGEFQVEHPFSGGGGRVGGVSSSTTTMVTVLPKMSSRLRLRSVSNISTYPNTDTTTSTTVPTSSQPLLEVDQQHITYIKQILISLIFGNRDTANETNSCNEEENVLNLTKDIKNSSNNNNSNKRAKLGYNTEIPICENGHTCSVCLISPNSAGFMCAYCAKLYTSDADLLKQNENILRFSLNSRMEVTLYKWSCLNCQYDVCLNCFPHSSYPPGGQLPYITNDEDVFSSTTGIISGTTSGCNNNRLNVNNNNSNINTTTEHMSNITTKRIICLIKTQPVTTTTTSNTTTTSTTTTTNKHKEDEISCKVRQEPSITSTEVSRVSQGSVIEVVDNPKSNYFYIENIGYVKKNPGKGAYWKRLQNDRYSCMYQYNDKEDHSLDNFINLSIQDNSNSSGGGSSINNQYISTTTTPTSVDIMGAIVRTMETIIQYDDYLKTNFITIQSNQKNNIDLKNTTTSTTTNTTTSSSIEEMQESVLVSVLELFTMVRYDYLLLYYVISCIGVQILYMHSIYLFNTILIHEW